MIQGLLLTAEQSDNGVDLDMFTRYFMQVCKLVVSTVQGSADLRTDECCFCAAAA